MNAAAASGIRVAHRPLGVDVDQAHLGGADLLRHLAFADVAFVAEPGVLGPPEDLLGLPHVLAAEGEAEGLEAHRLEGDVAREDEQVGPGKLLAVLLLHRPQQPPGLVQVGVVRPAVERREPLAAVPGAAAAVMDAVGAGSVPAHPDHQAAVVAEVRGPPVLGGGQDLDDVLLECLDVELLELLAVAERGAERVARRVVGVEHGEVQLVRPPVRDGPRPVRLGLRRVDRRVLALAAVRGHAASGRPGIRPQPCGPGPGRFPGWGPGGVPGDRSCASFHMAEAAVGLGQPVQPSHLTIDRVCWGGPSPVPFSGLHPAR